jgi:hypothetical protein
MFGEILRQALDRTLNEFGGRIAAFAPNLLAMLLILVAGIAIAGAVRVGVSRLFSLLGFDRLASRLGIQSVLERSGMRRGASNLVGLVLAWTVLSAFVLMAIGALNLQIAVDLLSRAFLFLPQVLVGIALLVLGMLAGGFVRRSVLIAAVNAGMPSARLLATGAQSAVMVLVIAMVLEHLGVGRQIIVVSFTILFGGLVLALALAFGLAGRELAGDVLRRLASRVTNTEGKDDTFHHL